MPPPMTSASTFFTRFISRSILVETLAPPTMATTGRAGLPRPFSSASSSACMVRPAKAGSRCASPSVEAWARCAAEKASLTKMSPFGGELFGEGRVVLLLALVEAGVFEQQDVAVVRCLATALGGLVADAVGGEGDGPADDLGRRRSAIGSSENSGSGPPFGPAEMGEQDDLGALVGQLGDGRRDALDAGRVGDLAVGDRHVEVDAHQHALAADVADVVEGLEGGHASPSRKNRRKTRGH